MLRYVFFLFCLVTTVIFWVLCVSCDFSLLGEPHDQGLVFKWGSLVGIRQSSSGANGSSPFVAGDVVFRPKEFMTAITTWANVPRCNTNFGDYDTTATDHLSRAHTPANFAKGWGDICRYMGVVDGSYWRIPTAAEWAELYGSDQQNKGRAVVLGNGWVNGSYYPLSGRVMGAGQNYVSVIGSETNARVLNADPWINGAVFLPASGYRHPTAGAIYSIGEYGDYWSSTAYTTDRGYDIQFNSSNVWPQDFNPRIFAFSVRCIRE